MQGSPTFELANDCFRFVTGYFEVISASSQHIYHSALVVAPRNSIVRKLYEPHTHPLTRVIRGVPTSWEASTAATARPSTLWLAVWSPCNRFIAITGEDTRTVDVLDSTTLQRLQTLEFPQDISTMPIALIFSPDGRVLTCSDVSSPNPPDLTLCAFSWDLQTGGVASIIRWQIPVQSYGEICMVYSANGKMVGVDIGGYIFVYNVASGIPIHSHLHLHMVASPFRTSSIWSYGDSLRFATVSATAITIWEVRSTSGAAPTEVETLPAPDSFGDRWRMTQFVPAPYRLALYGADRRVLVWDPRSSRCLLECKDVDFPPKMTFSSDGRFFACTTTGPDIYLWKDSPDGYILHGILVPNTLHSYPLLARNGELIVAFGDCAIQLWRTKSFIAPPSSISIRAPRHTKDFILEFSPCGTSVVAMQEDNTVIVLNLKSGVPQLAIDPSMEVCGLGVIGNTAVVIGGQKVVAWNLPARDRVPNALVGLEDRSWTISLCGSQNYRMPFRASISPDSRYIALIEKRKLHIHRTSTGEHLGERSAWTWTPRFSPDGRNIWGTEDGRILEVWRVGGGQEVLARLNCKPRNPPRGNPWGSSRGYRVTNDWWILDPGGKRLLMLPPPWRSYAKDRTWKGEFLALLHGGLSEPVILDLDVNCDL